MKTDLTDKWSLIAKKIANEEVPPEDDMIFDDWVASNENHELYSILKGIRLDCDYQTAIKMKKDVKKDIFARILSNGNNDKKNPRFLLSIAAGFAIFIVGYLVYNIVFDSKADNAIVEFHSSASGAKVILPDSTIVILNEDSRVAYDANSYNEKNRVITLCGEALFDVKHDANKPFIVNTDNIDVQVLGTTFDVKAYNNEDNIVVSLIAGSVQLTEKGKNQTLKLIPGQASSYNKKTTNLSLYTFRKDEVTAWTTPKLFFDKDTFFNVCKKLEKHFDVTITLKNKKLENKILTGRFTDNESLTDILDIMKVNQPFKYKIQNNEVLIY